METVFTEKLLEWNRISNRRRMPWKGEKDPYRIWLSEIILQQTRVEQGLSYYESFIKSYPTVQDIASAPDEEVFKLWEGLGYYSRCKNLLSTARYITNELSGRFPGDYNGLVKLKGVGPYTASAIASFAFEEPRAVVDGNVQRVIARYFGITTPIDSVPGKRLYQQLATELLNKETPSVYNQSIMDFGAVVCKPQQPLCNECPQRNECQAFLKGYVRILPVKEKKLLKRHRWFYYFLIQSGSSYFIRKRMLKDIWENLHEFVLFEKEDPGSPQHQNWLKQILGDQPFEIISQSRVYRQQLTHQTIHGQFIKVEVKSDLQLSSGYQKIDKAGFGKLAFPRMINQFIEEEDMV